MPDVSTDEDPAATMAAEEELAQVLAMQQRARSGKSLPRIGHQLNSGHGISGKSLLHDDRLLSGALATATDDDDESMPPVLVQRILPSVSPRPVQLPSMSPASAAHASPPQPSSSASLSAEHVPVHTTHARHWHPHAHHPQPQRPAAVQLHAQQQCALNHDAAQPQ
jgi:hypothetical protein